MRSSIVIGVVVEVETDVDVVDCEGEVLVDGNVAAAANIAIECVVVKWLVDGVVIG